MLILYIILFIIILTLLLCRIYAFISRKSFRKHANNGIQEINNQKVLCKIIKEYMAGLCFLIIRIIGIIPSFRLRIFLYKHIFLMKVGKNSKIRGLVEFSAPWNIEIGENTMIGQECKLDGRKGLYIGNNVNISDCVAIWTEQHDIQDEKFYCNNKGGKVVIQDRVWLGFRSIVLPNTNIGEGAVLACGAIATKSCDKFSLYTGIPARKIKDRNKNINYNLNCNYMHFM